MATLFVFTWILPIQSTLSAIPLSPEILSQSGSIRIEHEPLVANQQSPTSCVMPPCVNPCGEFESYYSGAIPTKPHCLGYPQTRCQGYAECNRGCYARYFDTDTGNEIFNCILIHPPPTPQPTTPNPTTPAPVPTTPVPIIPPLITPAPIMPIPNPPAPPQPQPQPQPLPQPQPQPVPWPDTVPQPAPYCVVQNLPSPGHLCNSRQPAADRCCQPGGPGSARCKYSGINFRGDALGVCCIKNNMEGCSQDTDCCGNDHICQYGICLKPLPGVNPLLININPNSDPNANPIPIPNPDQNPNPDSDPDANPNPNTGTNTNGASGPVEVPPVTLSDLTALGIGQKKSPPVVAPQTHGVEVNSNVEQAVAADSLPLEIIKPEAVTDIHDDTKGYGKYMSVGLTTGTMIWVSFVLLWLSLCSIMYWFRKRPEAYIDDIIDQEMIVSDSFDNMLEIATPKLEPVPVPAEIDDL